MKEIALTDSIPSLLEALYQVPDPRHASGKRHGLASILCFICCGMLCNATNLLAIFEWGRKHQDWCQSLFGFKRCTPCLNTLHRVLKSLDVMAFETVLIQWLSAQTPLNLAQGFQPIAIDGKTLRGSKTLALPGRHLLSAFAVDKGQVLAQVSAGKGKEIPNTIPLLSLFNLNDRVITGDANFPHQDLCEYIVQQGGHYLFEVKNNQASLKRFIAQQLSDGQADCEWSQTISQAHGRYEIRTLHVKTVLPSSLCWPTISQICRLVCQTQRQGSWQVQIHYKITSLRSSQASAKELLELSRGHWGIENSLHYVRDVTLREDASQIRTANAPQAIAAVRNLVIGLVRHVGIDNIASGLRQFSWDFSLAAKALGLSPIIN